MIRVEVDEGWLLVTHPEHARLAAAIAERWGNARFAAPEPVQPIRYAVAHHDDGWLARDATPLLTRALQPEAFTRELVGRYSAFEEIDLPAYLEVRRRATAAVAGVDPFAGLLVAMHTENLLTEGADPSTIRPEQRATYDSFLDEQRAWQTMTRAALGADAEQLQRGFEFLQWCDHLSLIACCDDDRPTALRHAQPDRHGDRQFLRCRRLRSNVWTIAPWPFDAPVLVFDVRSRVVHRRACCSLEAYRAAYDAAPPHAIRITLTEDDAGAASAAG